MIACIMNWDMKKQLFQFILKICTYLLVGQTNFVTNVEHYNIDIQIYGIKQQQLSIQLVACNLHAWVHFIFFECSQHVPNDVLQVLNVFRMIILKFSICSLVMFTITLQFYPNLLISFPNFHLYRWGQRHYIVR